MVTIFLLFLLQKKRRPQPWGANSVSPNRTKKSSGINASDHMKVQRYALIYISSIFLSALAFLLSIQITVIFMMKVILKKIIVSSMDSKKLHYWHSCNFSSSFIVPFYWLALLLFWQNKFSWVFPQKICIVYAMSL